MINLESIVQEVLSENINVAGPGGALGAGVASTETAFSGDNYARGDARVVKPLGTRVIRRNKELTSIYSGKVKGKHKHKRKHRRRR